MVLGATLGVLFAPRAGKDLRSKINADRKKGKIGISPLGDDLKEVGGELAKAAREIYESKDVQQLIKSGRIKVKGLSDELVGNIADFHVQRIKPLHKSIKSNIKSHIAKGKTLLKRADSELGDLNKKAKASAKIGKKAVNQIKKVIKKKSK